MDEPVAKEDWSTLSRSFRANRLKDLLVEVVICGGISCWMERRILQHGIRLIPWIAGDVPKILAAFRNGEISDPCFLMPGRQRCCQRPRENSALRIREKEEL